MLTKRNNMQDAMHLQMLAQEATVEALSALQDFVAKKKRPVYDEPPPVGQE